MDVSECIGQLTHVVVVLELLEQCIAERRALHLLLEELGHEAAAGEQVRL
jgi:hypothetical protein